MKEEIKLNLHKNLYKILEVDKNADPNQIKKSYYKLSKKYHPDVNPDLEHHEMFSEISSAWNILSDTDLKKDYDKRSKFGKDYNEDEEFFNINLQFNYKEAESNLEKVKNNVILDITINCDVNNFNGTLDFPRWIMCKKCDGNGKDKSTKFAIKNDKGEVKYFEGDDGCDFCEGSGKSWTGEDCRYCSGKGKVGINPCKSCSGEGRILGKQKLKDIKLSGDETVIKAMGHWNFGRCGNLIIKTKKD
jgi:DnaJ-class molecular chaperone